MCIDNYMAREITREEEEAMGWHDEEDDAKRCISCGGILDEDELELELYKCFGCEVENETT